MARATFLCLVGTVLVLVGLAAACGDRSDGPLLPVRSDTAWHLLSEGELATVYVEKALYEREDLSHFYVRLRVEPRGEGVVHLDLAPDEHIERSGFRPNQWGIHPEPRRGAINEMRLNQVAGDLTGEALERARARFTDGASGEWVAVGGPDGAVAVETFRAFNASSPMDVKASEGPFFILSLDGYLWATDGKRFENIANTGDDWDRFDLVLPRPIVWKQLPKGPGLFEPRLVPAR